MTYASQNARQAVNSDNFVVAKMLIASITLAFVSLGALLFLT